MSNKRLLGKITCKNGHIIEINEDEYGNISADSIGKEEVNGVTVICSECVKAFADIAIKIP